LPVVAIKEESIPPNAPCPVQYRTVNVLYS